MLLSVIGKPYKVNNLTDSHLHRLGNAVGKKPDDKPPLSRLRYHATKTKYMPTGIGLSMRSCMTPGHSVPVIAYGLGSSTGKQPAGCANSDLEPYPA